MARGFPDPSKLFFVIAGGPLRDCMRCGGWRCRDDKPKDCAICGKGLNASGRRGPYCSDTCAHAPRKAKKGTIAKLRFSVKVRLLPQAFREPLLDSHPRRAKGPRPAGKFYRAALFLGELLEGMGYPGCGIAIPSRHARQ
jgi:hypothetical protein